MASPQEMVIDKIKNFPCFHATAVGIVLASLDYSYVHVLIRQLGPMTA